MGVDGPLQRHTLWGSFSCRGRGGMEYGTQLIATQKPQQILNGPGPRGESAPRSGMDFKNP